MDIPERNRNSACFLFLRNVNPFPARRNTASRKTGTTIGYGDLIVNNTLARAVTVLFSVYSMALVAIFTSILAGYFVEIIKTEAKESAVKFLLDLERLPDMTHDELVELSERAKKFADKRW